MLRVSKSDDSSAISFCKEFKSGHKKRYLLGRSKYSESIYKQIDIDGFIDEFTTDKTYLGKKIVNLLDIDENDLVVSCVVIAQPISVLKKLIALNIKHLDYFKFYKYSDLESLEQPDMFDGKFEDDYNQNFNKYNWIYNMIEENESRIIFNNIINFRLNFDLYHMRNFKYNPEGQYFESFLKLNANDEIFADIGCFDGYTSLRFIDHCPNYKEIHCFEPDLLNVKKIKINLKNYDSIVYHDFGLSDKEETLKFNLSGSSSSGISELGSEQIFVKSLDSLDIPFTFLKLDIEGAEKKAIQGSVNTIIKYHPKIAISVYHTLDDLWKIPELILNIRSDYDVYLRHYTEGFAETVMFFVPKQQ